MHLRGLRLALAFVPLALVAACGDSSSDDPGRASDSASEDRSCEKAGADRACEDDDGKDGIQYCVHKTGAAALDFIWGTCVVDPECAPGDSKACEAVSTEFKGLRDYCVLGEGGVPGYDPSGCDTPLVLNFGAAPVAFTSPLGAAPFDISGLGHCATPDWPTSATPWLAIDSNHDGEIDGSELFGSGSILADGRRASNGFLALAELDSNGDGHITPADARYAELLVWTDRNADRRATPSELQPLSALGVVDIDLHYGSRRECDARGNCGVERASFGFEGASGESRLGEVVDVHLACGDR